MCNTVSVMCFTGVAGMVTALPNLITKMIVAHQNARLYHISAEADWMRSPEERWRAQGPIGKDYANEMQILTRSSAHREPLRAEGQEVAGIA